MGPKQSEDVEPRSESIRISGQQQQNTARVGALLGPGLRETARVARPRSDPVSPTGKGTKRRRGVHGTCLLAWDSLLSRLTLQHRT